ncbi:MAG: type I-E CRISPR-associated protein Cse1/CasA [Gemmatimonadota bacterium]|nr:type I-E CRISPR-associated protein Cse1/CasA [Gemmatimonadota bacterium]
MHPFNLLSDPFLPVVMRSGAQRWLAFPELAAGAKSNGLDEDYPVEFNWPRPDFNMASFEFCIGVVSLAFDIREEDDWRPFWTNPPDRDALAERLSPLVSAFYLNGEGPRFLQDHESLQGNETPIELLLIDTPGQNGQRKNSDLLTHRDRYAALGLPAAAMVLYTLQAYAPAGGAGNRTSMRGGGPLTALVVPTTNDGAQPVSLWRKIFANVVPCDERLRIDELPKALPWMAPTLTSEKSRTVSPADAHPLQAYFGMPRRIQLVFSSEPGICSMTGREESLVTGFIQKPYGINYGLWQHPLTPYRRQKEAEEPYSAKPKSGRFGYRDWVAATVGSKDGKLAEQPINIQLAKNNRSQALSYNKQAADARVRVGGWAMNNMEAIAYLIAEEPLHLAKTPDQQQALDELARHFSEAADQAVSQLLAALKKALFSGQKNASNDKGILDQARAQFFDATEDQFHHLLDDLLQEMPEDGRLTDPNASARHWLRIMRHEALTIFDRLAPVPLQDAEKAKTIVNAYGILNATFAGLTKQSKTLYDKLELPLPKKKPKAQKETT